LRERVVVLPRVALCRPYRPLAVGIVAIGAIDLVALDQGAVSGVANAGDDATEGVGEQKEGAAGVEADEASGQVIVVFVVEIVAASIIDVIFQTKGGEGIFGVAVAGAGLGTA
jgi:hypothetical protein